MKKLSDLFVDFPFKTHGNIPDIPISSVVADHRDLKSGDVFVAIKGYNIDSHEYIPEAVDRGASAVIGMRNIKGLQIPYIRVDNPRQSLAYLAAAFHNFPARKLIMIGVTGTDGKTTTVNLINHILITAGFKTGMISTVNAVIGDEVRDTGFHVTTPGAIEIQGYLAEMVKAGLTHCVLETTSHGWSQFRTDACEFDIGVLTNITHEHLNEHGTYENYRAAKARLFQSLPAAKKESRQGLRIAVINREDRSYLFMKNTLGELPQVKTLAYGLNDGEIHVSQIEPWDAGYSYFVEYGDQLFQIKNPLSGYYNISNSLAAIAATVIGLDIDPAFAQTALERFPGVPGRMEAVNCGQKFTALVDFAHTPNSLAETLKTIKTSKPHQVIAVFGSAGLRDKEKRQLMAGVSAQHADITIITAEDPRTEPLSKILSEMEAAALENGGVVGVTLFVVPDRREAIRKAVSLAGVGDTVVICGKGHEQSMCFGTKEFPWDDRIALRAALAEKLGVTGPEMPWLPDL